MGLVISAFIVKAGVDMLSQTLGQILGERVSPEVAETVKGIVAKDPDVLGVYDLILHSYGPERLVGSLHVEVRDTMDANAIDEMDRRIQESVYASTQGKVIVVAVGIYSRNTSSCVTAVRNDVTRRVMAHDHVIQMHGFHLDEERGLMAFDVIISFDAPDRMGEYRQIVSEVQGAYPQYRVDVTLDTDVSD